MNDMDIWNGLREIFADVFSRDDIVLTPELTAKDVKGWDSFKQIEIILATEARFGIKMSTREVDRLHNVGDLAQVIAVKA